MMRPPNTVRCDHSGCGVEIYVERSWKPNAARNEAAANGWTCRDGLDFCPAHSLLLTHTALRAERRRLNQLADTFIATDPETGVDVFARLDEITAALSD